MRGPTTLKVLHERLARRWIVSVEDEAMLMLPDLPDRVRHDICLGLRLTLLFL